MNIDKPNEIIRLNELLANELAAVESYTQLIGNTPDSLIVERLAALRQSHAARAAQLREHICSQGGEPVQSAGLWGGVVDPMDDDGRTDSEQDALAILEEGEDKVLRDYRDELDVLGESSRNFVAGMLLPAQQRSHDELRQLIGHATTKRGGGVVS